MRYLLNVPIFRVAYLIITAILFISSPPLYAENASELYNLGLKAYQDKDYVVALKFLAAYKYHPDANKSNAGRLKSVDDAIQAIETELKSCKPEKHASGGVGGSFHGGTVLKRANEY